MNRWYYIVYGRVRHITVGHYSEGCGGITDDMDASRASRNHIYIYIYIYIYMRHRT